jgi:hypothetical protein
VRRRLREETEQLAGPAERRKPSPPCWLCGGKGGITIHTTATAQFGEGVWVAAVGPSSLPSVVKSCPACRLAEALDMLEESRGFIERMAAMLHM